MFIIGLIVVMLTIWLFVKIFSFSVDVFLWLAIKIPVGAILVMLGFMLCCTIILIGPGKKMIASGFALMIP